MSRLEIDDDPEFELERTFGWLMHDVHRLFNRVWERRLRDSGLGLSQPQARVVANLYRREGMTQTELADEVEMQRAPLGRLLDRMEETGWIVRRPDPDDRRIKRVYCTDKVAEVLMPMRESARGLISVALEGFSHEEIAQLIALLTALKANLLVAEGSDPGVVPAEIDA